MITLPVLSYAITLSKRKIVIRSMLSVMCLFLFLDKVRLIKNTTISIYKP